MKLQSYMSGQWVEGSGQGVEIFNAINGESVGEVTSTGVDFKAALEYGREKGAALRAMTFHERATMLKALAKHLMDKKEDFYRISAWTGATRADSWVDIEGGLGTVFTLSLIHI